MTVFWNTPPSGPKPKPPAVSDLRALAERIIGYPAGWKGKRLRQHVLDLGRQLEAAERRYRVLVEVANEVVRRVKRPESFEDLPLVPSIDRLEAALLALEGQEEKP